MSHLRERKEKSCLNCQATVHGRYCHVCGQENTEPHESFWHLVTHFVYDVTHFDGKFFSTLKYLLFRPGFLSHEYLKGRRASYLHPIRMYVFTSAFFFLVFFSMSKDGEMVKMTETQSTAKELIERLEKKKTRTQEKLKKDSLNASQVQRYLAQLSNIDSDLVTIRKDTSAREQLITFRDDFNFLGSESDFKTVKAYDSAQAALPVSDRAGFFERRFTRQNLHLREKYHDDSKEIWKAIVEKFKHLFPQMLFVSLPLFALALQLLYVRRKKFYYVNHVIYTIHLYCGTFILILIGILLAWLMHRFHWDTDWLTGIFTLLGFFYWYKCMRGFYEQGRRKTILKYILVMFLSLFIMSFIFAIFIIFSAMSI
ncbi:DUF3667 domain-containing protein [Sediminibacterium soli]|uniref:DUF3667 domain-containing protein n=1 Tax=Sediminibacterium soli TaxID=2698829 RepID=UPI00137B1569|nr:DUF3667 domain-containing protein [Sediminibacterium soli]NCI46564.1 DUF3667 domain-containing protein [Sediminibacterium soli]